MTPIWTANVAAEERVAREQEAATVFKNDAETTTSGRVTRRMNYRGRSFAKPYRFIVLKRLGEQRLSWRRDVIGRRDTVATIPKESVALVESGHSAGCINDRERPHDVIEMGMCVNNGADLESVRADNGQYAIGLVARINDNRLSRRLARDDDAVASKHAYWNRLN